jgi:membrane protease subunit (stomatin/prohibitin family)
MMLGGTAYVAGRAGAKAGAAKAQQDQQEQPQQESAAAPQAAAPTTEEKFAQLESLKRLLDEGVLTEAEFETQKQKLLAQL